MPLSSLPEMTLPASAASPPIRFSVPPEIATQDFMIQGPREHGLPGLVNLFGIESPGLTSSLAIAAYVANLIG